MSKRVVRVHQTHVQLLNARSYISISCIKMISVSHGTTFVQGLNTDIVPTHERRCSVNARGCIHLAHFSRQAPLKSCIAKQPNLGAAAVPNHAIPSMYVSGRCITMDRNRRGSRFRLGRPRRRDCHPDSHKAVRRTRSRLEVKPSVGRRDSRSEAITLPTPNQWACYSKRTRLLLLRTI